MQMHTSRAYRPKLAVTLFDAMTFDLSGTEAWYQNKHKYQVRWVCVICCWFIVCMSKEVAATALAEYGLCE